MFHSLFGHKWDAAIILFQILTVRGIFVVLTSLYSNYLLALGYGRRLFALEVAKDLLILAAILSTVWFGSVPLLVWGQLAASVVTYVVSLLILRRAAGFSVRAMVRDLLPSMAIAGVSCLVVAVALYAAGLSGWLSSLSANMAGLIQLGGGLLLGIGSYLLLCRLARLPELREAVRML